MKVGKEFLYPSNHWIHFSEDQYLSNMYKGTQCSDLTFQSTEYEDYTSSCAYAVKVDRVDHAKVVRGVATIKDGRVSYE
jgi:hypothetical protein